jgi:hypothetical protein
MGLFDSIKHAFHKAVHVITHPKEDVKKIIDIAKHPKNIIDDAKKLISKGGNIAGDIPIPGIGGGLGGLESAGVDIMKESLGVIKSGGEIVETLAKDLPKFIEETGELVFDEGGKLLKAIISLVNLLVGLLEKLLSGLNIILDKKNIRYTAVVVLLAFMYMYRYKQ